ncbi:MAG: hypothetical protein R3237_00620 [Nitrosopumilaceae archaeon]|nr:hypothetical protein [Nitrosopumilaceae archaeon]
MQPVKYRSKWWYLLPIFMGVIGGLITWFALKNDDRKLAKNCLILGIILDSIHLVFLLSLLVSDNLNLITQLDPLMDSNDLGFQFQIETP